MTKEFVGVESQELSVELGSIVFVLSLPEDGWVFVENLQGKRGYVPWAYLTALLPPNLIIHGKLEDIECSINGSPISLTSSTRGENLSKMLVNDLIFVVKGVVQKTLPFYIHKIFSEDFVQPYDLVCFIFEIG